MSEHYHKDERGVLVKCYHGAKSLLVDWRFWVGVTISFPLEHFIWTKVPGFMHISGALGLIDHLH